MLLDNIASYLTCAHQQQKMILFIVVKLVTINHQKLQEALPIIQGNQIDRLLQENPDLHL